LYLISISLYGIELEHQFFRLKIKLIHGFDCRGLIILALVRRLYRNKSPCEANPSIGYNLVKPIVEGPINIKTCSKIIIIIIIFLWDTHLVGISGKKREGEHYVFQNAHCS